MGLDRSRTALFGSGADRFGSTAQAGGLLSN